MQTDSVTNIPCGTSGGVLIHFDKVDQGVNWIALSAKLRPPPRAEVFVVASWRTPNRVLRDQVEVVNRLNREMVYDTVKNYTIHCACCPFPACARRAC